MFLNKFSLSFLLTCIAKHFKFFSSLSVEKWVYRLVILHITRINLLKVQLIIEENCLCVTSSSVVVILCPT